MVNAVEVKNLKKEYPQPGSFFDLLKKERLNKISALDGIDLKVKKGDFFGVLGPNGAGKTTLTKILCTLILPTKGEVKVNGFNLLKEGGDIRRTVGLVSSDERSFYWKLTGRQNLLFFSLLQDFTREEAKNRVKTVLEEVGLSGRADSRFETYSSGMKQKMSIARGLINEPETLFMDEPTRSLDPNAAREIRDFIRDKSNEGMTIFLTTHNLPEAEELCNKVAILHRGRVRGSGSVKDLLNTIKQTDRLTIEVDGVSEEKLKNHLGNRSSVLGIEIRPIDVEGFKIDMEIKEGAVSEILEIIRTLGGRIKRINTDKTSLEKIFGKLTKGAQR